MSRIIALPSVKVKAARKTTRRTARSAPASSATSRVSAASSRRSDVDRAAAARMFSDEPDRDTLAGEAVFIVSSGTRPDAPLSPEMRVARENLHLHPGPVDPSPAWLKR